MLHAHYSVTICSSPELVSTLNFSYASVAYYSDRRNYQPTGDVAGLLSQSKPLKMHPVSLTRKACRFVLKVPVLNTGGR